MILPSVAVTMLAFLSKIFDFSNLHQSGVAVPRTQKKTQTQPQQTRGDWPEVQALENNCPVEYYLSAHRLLLAFPVRIKSRRKPSAIPHGHMDALDFSPSFASPLPWEVEATHVR